MSRATPKMQEFAQRLIAHEAKGNKSSRTNEPATFPVVAKLRPHLATLMGNAGFRALLSRALALAHAEAPALRAVQVKMDGSLEELPGLTAELGPEELFEGKVALLAQLLALLVAFIGEGLTERMVREIWPKLPLNHLDPSKGDKK